MRTTTTTCRTHPPAGSELHREEERTREARSRGKVSAISRGEVEILDYAKIKKRKAEKERSPPRQAEEISSRQQALPHREWVAPRRPRINKTTARPSPVLGPAWPLPAVWLARRRTPDVPTRRACPRRAVALSARAPIPGRDDAAARRRVAPRRAPARSSADRAHARSRAKLALPIDILRWWSGASSEKIREKCIIRGTRDSFPIYEMQGQS